MIPTSRSAVAGLLLSLTCITALPHTAQAVTAAVQDGKTALFPRANSQGDLRVAVIHVTPPAAPGAKIRTEDRLDVPVIRALAQSLQLKAQPVQMTPDQAQAALADGTIDLALYSLPADAKIAADVTSVPTSYQTYPKAVIRSDTPMRSPDDLRGRSVCIADTARHAAQEASRAGATLMSFRVPSDALVAVREGKCDLGLIDQTVWQDLQRFPEWKKFSATIELPDHPRTLSWLVPASNGRQAEWLRAQMQQWDATGQWAAFRKKWATDVAFDVYLDQEVPDCHS